MATQELHFPQTHQLNHILVKLIFVFSVKQQCKDREKSVNMGPRQGKEDPKLNPTDARKGQLYRTSVCKKESKSYRNDFLQRKSQEEAQ